MGRKKKQVALPLPPTPPLPARVPPALIRGIDKGDGEIVAKEVAPEAWKALETLHGAIAAKRDLNGQVSLLQEHTTAIHDMCLSVMRGSASPGATFLRAVTPRAPPTSSATSSPPSSSSMSSIPYKEFGGSGEDAGGGEGEAGGGGKKLLTPELAARVAERAAARAGTLGALSGLTVAEAAKLFQPATREKRPDLAHSRLSGAVGVFLCSHWLCWLGIECKGGTTLQRAALKALEGVLDTLEEGGESLDDVRLGIEAGVGGMAMDIVQRIVAFSLPSLPPLEASTSLPGGDSGDVARKAEEVSFRENLTSVLQTSERISKLLGKVWVEEGLDVLFRWIVGVGGDKAARLIVRVLDVVPATERVLQVLRECEVEEVVKQCCREMGKRSAPEPLVGKVTAAIFLTVRIAELSSDSLSRESSMCRLLGASDEEVDGDSLLEVMAKALEQDEVYGKQYVVRSMSKIFPATPPISVFQAAVAAIHFAVCTKHSCTRFTISSVNQLFTNPPSPPSPLPDGIKNLVLEIGGRLMHVETRDSVLLDSSSQTIAMMVRSGWSDISMRDYCLALIRNSANDLFHTPHSPTLPPIPHFPTSLVIPAIASLSEEQKKELGPHLIHQFLKSAVEEQNDLAAISSTVADLTTSCGCDPLVHALLQVCHDPALFQNSSLRFFLSSLLSSFPNPLLIAKSLLVASPTSSTTPTSPSPLTPFLYPRDPSTPAEQWFSTDMQVLEDDAFAPPPPQPNTILALLCISASITSPTTSSRLLAGLSGEIEEDGGVGDGLEDICELIREQLCVSDPIPVSFALEILAALLASSSPSPRVAIDLLIGALHRHAAPDDTQGAIRNGLCQCLVNALRAQRSALLNTTRGEEGERRKVVEDGKAFLAQVGAICFRLESPWTPGAAQTRTAMAAECVNTLLDEWGEEGLRSGKERSALIRDAWDGDGSEDGGGLDGVFGVTLGDVKRMVRMMVCVHGGPRAALERLIRFRLHTIRDVDDVVEWATVEATSLEQRNSDGAAMVFATISPPTKPPDSLVSHILSSAVNATKQMESALYELGIWPLVLPTVVLSARSHLLTSFPPPSDLPLAWSSPHGLLRALTLLVPRISDTNLVLDVALWATCLAVAALGGDEDDHRVDCRGHPMFRPRPSTPLLAEDSSALTPEVVAGYLWSVVRDGSGLLAAVVKRGLLSVEQVDGVGNVLLRNALRSRHFGSVGASETAIAIVTSAALLHKPTAHLPLTWLESVLVSLGAGTQDRFLRRAGGVRAATMAIVEAERGLAARNARRKVHKGKWADDVFSCVQRKSDDCGESVEHDVLEGNRIYDEKRPLLQAVLATLVPVASGTHTLCSPRHSDTLLPTALLTLSTTSASKAESEGEGDGDDGGGGEGGSVDEERRRRSGGVKGEVVGSVEDVPRAQAMAVLQGVLKAGDCTAALPCALKMALETLLQVDASWAVRNGALMVFSVCVTHLLKTPTPLYSMVLRPLLPLLLEALNAPSKPPAPSSSIPALTLLTRVSPLQTHILRHHHHRPPPPHHHHHRDAGDSGGGGGDGGVTEEKKEREVVFEQCRMIHKAVRGCLSSPDVGVRSAAAQTIASLVGPSWREEVPYVLRALDMDGKKVTSSWNMVDGVLRALLHLLPQKPSSIPTLLPFLTSFHPTPPPMVAALVMRLLVRVGGEDEAISMAESYLSSSPPTSRFPLDAAVVEAASIALYRCLKEDDMDGVIELFGKEECGECVVVSLLHRLLQLIRSSTNPPPSSFYTTLLPHLPTILTHSPHPLTPRLVLLIASSLLIRHGDHPSHPTLPKELVAVATRRASEPKTDAVTRAAAHRLLHLTNSTPILSPRLILESPWFVRLEVARASETASSALHYLLRWDEDAQVRDAIPNPSLLSSLPERWWCDVDRFDEAKKERLGDITFEFTGQQTTLIPTTCTPTPAYLHAILHLFAHLQPSTTTSSSIAAGRALSYLLEDGIQWVETREEVFASEPDTAAFHLPTAIRFLCAFLPPPTSLDPELQEQVLSSTLSISKALKVKQASQPHLNHFQSPRTLPFVAGAAIVSRIFNLPDHPKFDGDWKDGVGWVE